VNHCFDCNSSYATPGTCNCFAVGGKRYAGRPITIGPAIPWGQWVPMPYMPTPAPQPWFVPVEPPTITWTCGDA
jgi:hypothetical protein